eukprot:5354429-Alexandrium_andersonii.AAC.1
MIQTPFQSAARALRITPAASRVSPVSCHLACPSNMHLRDSSHLACPQQLSPRMSPTAVTSHVPSSCHLA